MIERVELGQQVVPIGGDVREYVVELDPARMQALGTTLRELLSSEAV